MSLSDLVTSESLLIQFIQHPTERDMIGKIILAYGELEVMLTDLLRAALDGDTMAAIKVLYRLRSESNRIDIADAIVRPKVAKHGLEGQYDEALNALNHCKKIRNHYTHSQWITENGVLRFGSLDDAARAQGQSKIRFRAISPCTLRRQYDYFGYTQHILSYVADQYRLKTAQPRMIEQKIPKPKRVPPVSLDSREETQPPRLKSRARKPRGK